MQVLRPISELCMRVYSEIQEKAVLENAVGMRRLSYTSVLATEGVPVYRKLSQAQYDKAITDKNIRTLEHDTNLYRREALTAQMSSRARKANNVE
jgi:hypothetical protein